MLARTLNDFHHWLPASKLVFAPSIILDPVQGLPASLASEVARHLNEFDDGAEGRWIAFAPELIEAIARDSAQLSLLGLDDERGRMFSADPNSIRRRVLKALARRGTRCSTVRWPPTRAVRWRPCSAPVWAGRRRTSASCICC